MNKLLEMSKKELFTMLYPNEKATSGNRKYTRATKPQLVRSILLRGM